MPGVDEGAPRCEIPQQVVKAAMWKLSKGAAPGITGATNRHFRTIAASPGGLEALTRIVNKIANWEMPAEFYRAVHTA
jgi:hypothetical protein